MIRVFRNLSAPTCSRWGSPPAADDFLWLDRDPAPYTSWSGLRSLLSQMASRCGTATVREILDRHPAPASLLFDDLEARLSPADRELRGRLRCRLDSHMSHNWSLQRPLFEAWAELLVDLLEDEPVRLFVSDIGRLDWETATTLTAVYRLFRHRAPDLVLTFYPRRPRPQPDADGVLWWRPPEEIVEVVIGFQSIPTTETVDVPAGTSGGPADGIAARGAGDAAEDGPDLEARAFRALSSSARSLSEETSQLVVEAVESSFRRFSFTTALRLGLDLLARKPPLEPLDAATVHDIIGLSAHNRQFRSAGNRALAELLERHFRAALETETRPILRCALLYRLAVALGRRKKDFEAAREYAERAVAAARTSGLGEIDATYQESWALNIRAFLRMQSGDERGAREDLLRSLELLGSLEPLTAADGTWARDVAFSRPVVASNLSGLLWRQGDRAGSRYWRNAACEMEQSHRGAERYAAGKWIDLCRLLHQPGSALPRALGGWRSARAENDGLRLFRYTIESADLSYQLGRPRDAVRFYRHSRSLRDRFGNPPFLPDTSLAAVAACGRAGLFEEGQGWLEEALARKAPAGARAEILAAGALLAARCGRVEEADAPLEEALELTREGDADEIQLCVEGAAGRVYQLLERWASARRAYERALEVSRERKASPAIAEACLGALVGLQEIDGPDVARVRSCLDLLPAALSESEAWWHLRRLLELVIRALEEQSGSRVLAADGALEPLLRAAEQRPDCTAPLRRLADVMPEARAFSATDGC